MKRTDPLTSQEFIPKRRNQVFKTRHNRIRWNNEKAAQIRQIKSNMEKVLTKNLLILTELVRVGETKDFKKEDLILQGYYLNAFTHLTKYEGNTCHSLYVYIFPKNDNPNYITIKYPKND